MDLQVSKFEILNCNYFKEVHVILFQSSHLMKSRNHLLALLIIFVATSFSAQSQDLVVIEKPGTSKRIRYQLNDEIVFRLKDTAALFRGPIQKIEDSLFIVNGTRFYYNQVSKVRNRKPYRFQRATAFTLLNGTVSIAAIQVVYGLAASQYPLIDKTMRILLSSTASISGILYASRRYWYHLESGKYRIRRLDTNIEGK